MWSLGACRQNVHHESPATEYGSCASLALLQKFETPCRSTVRVSTVCCFAHIFSSPNVGSNPSSYSYLFSVLGSWKIIKIGRHWTFVSVSLKPYRRKRRILTRKMTRKLYLVCVAEENRLFSKFPLLLILYGVYMVSMWRIVVQNNGTAWHGSPHLF